MPRVSICIPSYKPQHFEQCLQSAFSQTYQDIEILVSDDCPDDAIEQICRKYATQLSYSRNPNPGVGRNLLRAIYLSKGEYIKCLFDDDVLHPTCVEKLLQCFESGQTHNIKLAFSPRYIIDGDGKVRDCWNRLGVKDNLIVLEGRAVISLMAQLIENFIGEYTTTMFRKSDAIDSDGENRLFYLSGELLKGLTDVSAWVNLAQKGNVAVYPEPLSYFRRHAASNSNPSVNSELVLAYSDWEIVLRHAINTKALVGADIVTACTNLLKCYASSSRLYPSLMNDAGRLIANGITQR